jgi:hypothetical protein
MGFTLPAVGVWETRELFLVAKRQAGDGEWKRSRLVQRYPGRRVFLGCLHGQLLLLRSVTLQRPNNLVIDRTAELIQHLLESEEARKLDRLSAAEACEDVPGIAGQKNLGEVLDEGAECA